MSIELPELNNSLDLKHRLALEVALMDKMIGAEASQDEKLAWIEKNSDQVRETIFRDDEIGKTLRELGETEQYGRAADILLQELNKNPEDLRQAA